MAANNDFFVKFDSNATAFAGELDRKLVPARKVINDFRALLAQAAAEADSVGAGVHKGGGGPPPGTQNPRSGGGEALGLDITKLQRSLDLAAVEQAEIATQAHKVLQGVSATADELAEMPGKIKGSILSLIRTIQGQAQAANQPRSGGKFDTSGGAAPERKLTIDKSLIANTKASAIDKANFDRVVDAIRDQTEALKRGGRRAGTVPETDATVETSSTKKRKSAEKAVSTADANVDKALESRIDNITKALADYDAGMKQIEQLVAASGNEAAVAELESMRKQRADLASEKAKLEREQSGLTRKQQQAKRSKDAAVASDARPNITDVEKEDRLRRQRLINQAGSDDFDEQVLKKKGGVTVKTLHEMAAAMESVGVAIERTTKTPKDVLAARVKAGFDQYTQLHPTGAPELATSARDVRVQKTTKIPEETTAFLGEIRQDLVEARRVASAIRRAHFETGGSELDEVTGEQQGKRPKRYGRQEFGAAILDDDIALSPLARTATRAEVIAAGKYLAPDPDSQKANIRRASRDENFNIFDKKYNPEYGQGEDEKALASTVSAQLRNARLAQVSLDKMGKEYLLLDEAVKENTAFIARASRRLKNGEDAPSGLDDDEQKIAEARAQVIKNQQRRKELEEESGGLVKSESFQRGVVLRTPERQAFEGAAELREAARRDNFSTFRDLKEGLLQAISSRGAIAKQIPDAIIRGGNLTRSANAGGLGPVDQRKLNSAVNSWTKAADSTLSLRAEQRATIGPVTEADHNILQDAEENLERQANRLANRLATIFNGLAPSLQSLTGRDDFEGSKQDSFNAKTDRDEERRRRTREQAEADKKAKPLTDKAKKERAELAVLNAENRLAVATEDRKEVAARAAAQEKKILGKTELTSIQLQGALEQYSEATKKAAQLQIAQNRLISARRQIEDPANYTPENYKNADKPGDRGDYQRGIATGGMDIPGHAAGPIKTVDDYVNLLDSQIQDASNKYIESERRRYDSLGYASHLGYEGGGPSAGGPSNEQLKADLDLARATRAQIGALRDQVGGTTSLTKAIDSLEAQRASTISTRDAGIKGAGLDKSQVSTMDEYLQHLKAADRAVEESNAALSDARQKQAALTEETKKSTKAEKDGTTAKRSATTAALAEANAKLDRIRKDRVAVKAEGPYTQDAIDAGIKRRKKAKTDEEKSAIDQEIAAIRDRKRRLTDLRKEEKSLPAGVSKRAAGPPLPPAGGGTGIGGAGDFGRASQSLLSQILGELKRIHATLKGPLKVVGARGAAKAAEAEAAAAAAGATTTDASGTPKKATRSEKVAAINAEVEVARDRRLRNLKKKNADADVKDAERQQKASEDTQAEARNAARAAEDLARALRQLSPETEREIAALKRLNAAEQNAATVKAVAAQQAKVAAGIDRDLQAKGVGATDRKGTTRAVLNNVGPQLGSGELDSIFRSVRSANPKQIGVGFGEDMGDGAIDGFSRVFGGGNSFWSRVLHTTGTFVVRNFAAGFVFGLTNYMQQVLDQAIQAEATFVKVRAALEATGKDLGNIRGDLQDISTDYGVALNDTYTAAAGLTGLFDNSEDLAAGTRVVAQLQAISGGALNATEATGVLASTLSAFQRQLGETDTGNFLPDDTLQAVTHVADVLTTIQNQMGVNVEVAAEGVSSMAGLARSLNLSLEEAAVFSSQIAKQTNQTGAAAGEQFSRILGSLQTGRGRDAVLQAYNPTTAGSPEQEKAALQVRQGLEKSDYGQILRGMVAGWADLDDAQKRNVATAVAGQRQMRAFIALMNGGTKSLNTLAAAEDSTGAAADRMDKLMETLNKRLDKFSTEVQVLASNLIRAGILDFLGILLVVTTEVLDLVNKVLSAFNAIADANPALDSLRHIIAVLIGGAIAFKAFNAGLSGLRRATRQFRAENDTSLPPDDRVRRAPYAGGGAFLSTQVGSRSPILGRSAYGVQGVSDRLNAAAVARLEKAAALRETFRDQQRYSSTPIGQQAAMRAQFAADHDEEEARRRTQRPDTSLLRQADGADRASKAAGRAAGATQGLANTMDKLSKTGLAAEGAMVLLGLAVAAFFESQARHAEQSKSWREGYDRLTKSARAAQAAEGTDPDAFLGQTNETYYNAFDDMKNAGRFNQALGAGGAILSNPGTLLNLIPGGGNLPGAMSVEEAIGREFGIDTAKNETYGLSRANDLIKQAEKDLDPELSRTSGEVAELTKKYSDILQAEATAIANDKSTSDGEKQAAIANLEAYESYVNGLLDNLGAIAAGAKNAIALTSDEINNIQALTGTRQSLTSGVQAGGLDLQPLLKELQGETGSANTPGSETQKYLNRITDPDSDTIDVLLANRNLLKEEIISLEARWRTAADEDPAGDAAVALKSQLQSTIAQYGSANDGIFAAMQENANLLANQLFAQGKPGEAMRVYAQAMARADDQFEKESRIARQAIRRARRAWVSIMVQASKVDEMLGGEGFDISIPQNRQGRFKDGKPAASKSKKERDAKYNQQMADNFQQYIDQAIFLATRSIDLQIARTTDAATRQGLELLKAQITGRILKAVNDGKSPGYGLPAPGKAVGDLAVDEQEMHANDIAIATAQTAATESQEESGNTAAQNAAALRQAQLGVAQAWADARGDAVKSAQIQVLIAKATIAAARADLAAAKTADETNSARISILNAQAQLIAAHAAVQAAQGDLVQSQYDVTIALAEAAGHTVQAASLTLAAARRALADAIKKSGGKATAEVNAARVSAIQAQAALRDARLQDDLDTIDFNLEMGKLTQSSAIKALQEILKTRDLTRDQRRQLMLQIKGMKDELGDSQWNFGDIKLPTPYQMRKYITERRNQFRGELEAAAGGGNTKPGGGTIIDRPPYGNGNERSSTSNSVTNITIDGADIGLIRRLLTEIVGSSSAVNTRTTAARRGGAYR